MAGHTSQGDIKSQLNRLGALLSALPESRREAFFNWLREGDSAPMGKAAPSFRKSYGPSPPPVIRLIGPRRSTSVALSEPLLVALRDYSTKQGIRLSMSALVEFLIWQFLGEPDELIERKPTARSSQGTIPKDLQEEKFASKAVNEFLTELEEPTELGINNDNENTD